MSPVRSWPISIGFFIGLAAVAISAMSRPVHADEAYLCGPDKVIYVSATDLPKMKRTNACVAAYYGLKVEAVAAVEAPSKPKRAIVAQAPVAKRTKPAQVALKPMSEPEPSPRAADMPVRQASLAVAATAAAALPGTDYRNVKILNAANPSDAVYRHTK